MSKVAGSQRVDQISSLLISRGREEGSYHAWGETITTVLLHRRRFRYARPLRPVDLSLQSGAGVVPRAPARPLDKHTIISFHSYLVEVQPGKPLQCGEHGSV